MNTFITYFSNFVKGNEELVLGDETVACFREVFDSFEYVPEGRCWVIGSAGTENEVKSQLSELAWRVLHLGDRYPGCAMLTPVDLSDQKWESNMRWATPALEERMRAARRFLGLEV